MKVIYNNIIPFKGFYAINLFGTLFVRGSKHPSKKVLNHESIHSQQMKELLYIFFYLWYVTEWLIKLFIYWDTKMAYKAIGFEQEAYTHEEDMEYLKNRHWYSFLNYIV